MFALIRVIIPEQFLTFQYRYLGTVRPSFDRAGSKSWVQEVSTRVFPSSGPPPPDLFLVDLHANAASSTQQEDGSLKLATFLLTVGAFQNGLFPFDCHANATLKQGMLIWWQAQYFGCSRVEVRGRRSACVQISWQAL